MKTFISLFLVVLLTGCAASHQPVSRSLYSTECGSFPRFGMRSACMCLETDSAKSQLGERWQESVQECHQVAGLPTDEDISFMSESEVCSRLQYAAHDDPRLVERANIESFQCDPYARKCRDRGYKSGTSKFTKCVDTERRMVEDPSFVYCVDRGFEIGTQNFSACTVEADKMFAQIHQNNMMLNAIERQRAENEQARRAEAWRALGQSLISSAPASRSSSTTTCREVLPGQVNCTTW